MSRPDLPDFASLVETHLKWGTPVTISEIAEDMKVSRRQVEKAIEELRASGRPVCSGASGVWITMNEAELVEQYRALRRRYIRQAVNARVLLATAKRYAKQQQATLWG